MYLREVLGTAGSLIAGRGLIRYTCIGYRGGVMYSIGQFIGIGTQLEVIVDPFGMECGPLGCLS